jgi:hypothetical protein
MDVLSTIYTHGLYLADFSELKNKIKIGSVINSLSLQIPSKRNLLSMYESYTQLKLINISLHIDDANYLLLSKLHVKYFISFTIWLKKFSIKL